MALLCLCGCETRQTLAPVVELNWKATSHSDRHVVMRGDTLYAIAFRYDKDYRQLATLNRLKPHDTLRVGQVVWLRAVRQMGRKPTILQPAIRPYQKRVQAIPRVMLASTARWLWPIQGRVLHSFIPQQGRKGIDIAGKQGDNIRAAASGIVAYAGNGLSGYGNLIIIKHNNEYMTAYGNNLRNVVKEGQMVQAGQIIANIGLIERRYWGVHFEIRKSGQPVNPLSYLKNK